MDINQKLTEELDVNRWQIDAAVTLIDEGNTIPFISRYRKEATGSLNDEQLRKLHERLLYLRNLEEKKEQVISSIEEQGKMTEELKEKILLAETLVTVEDLYRPYRPKRRTRATIAKEKGLEPLAAICLGGSGAVFWMWLTAILGSASAFIESTLAQIYKHKAKDGSSYGGPAYYIQAALKKRWIGVLFAVVLILTYMGGFNLVASFNIADSFRVYSFFNPEWTPLIVGAILAVVFALAVFGGSKKISQITEVLVPVMGIFYLAVSLFIILKHYRLVPVMFTSIFNNAFDVQAIFGGFAGSCVMHGIKRGLFSNEAGVGSAPNAAASAAVSHPVKQGLVQMLSVFIDTILICSATAFMLLCSGVEPTSKLAGMPWVQAAASSSLGGFGTIFITIALCLFAFTTLIGNFYYAEMGLKFLCGRKPPKAVINTFRIIAAAIVLAGATMEFSIVWNTADVLMGLMALINLPVILILCKPAIQAMNDYTKQKKAGKDPVFKAADIQLKDKTDFWN